MEILGKRPRFVSHYWPIEQFNKNPTSGQGKGTVREQATDGALVIEHALLELSGDRV
jgi:hypothetical protein